MVRDWLAASHQARILHVFDEVCNLTNERREVLSVVTQRIGNGPFNLVIDGEVCLTDHLDVQSPVSFRADQLNLGELRINTDNAEVWSPCPDWGKLRLAKSDIIVQLKSLPISNYRSQLPDTLIANFVTALAAADISSALQTTSRLAGLGIGLTPAGDDFMFGALLAVWIIHPAAVAAGIAEDIVKAAAPLTTSLSAAWLRSVGKGEAGKLWHDYFQALISADHKEIQETMAQILAVGETSGADALAGFTGVLLL